MVNREYYLEKIKRFCLMDDTFMSKVFEDKACAELLLKIILQKELTVKEVTSQYTVKKLQGRSIRLDIFAVDKDNKYYNIEVQNESNEAIPKRARYNSSLIDANITDIGGKYDELPENYVIFIIRHDVLKGGKPIYTIERTIKELGNIDFGDESHIIYVNGECQDETEIGKLMHDFFCQNAEDMNYEVLAERVSYFKNETGGVDTMCQISEEIRRDAAEEAKRESAMEIALKMLKESTLSVEKIAQITSLTIDEVKALAEKKVV